MISLDHLANASRDDRFNAALAQLRPGDLAVDCGANFGTITKKFRRRKCLVHAFEPDPTAVGRLKALFADDDKVIIHEAAVAVRPGRAKLYFHKHRALDDVHTQSSSLFEDKAGVNLGTFVNVRLVDFPAFVESLDQRIAILKMDIEGAEAPVLLELIRRGLYRKFDCAFVETHEEKVPSTKETMGRVRRKISELGIRHIFLDWL